jgi:CRP/FNR family transcriptional regulator, cyclic AMP receptor protein
VLDGLLLRRVDLGGRVGAELLGRGDLLQPWMAQPPEETVQVTCRWEVLSAARLAVLDARFEAVIARWPALASALLDSATRRTRMLAFQHAVCHYPALEDRLLALLWAFAERWGRVTPEGVVLPFRLTHATLAEISGTTRPSVSTALGELRRKEAVVCRGKSWLLPAQGSCALPDRDAATPLAA